MLVLDRMARIWSEVLVRIPGFGNQIDFRSLLLSAFIYLLFFYSNFKNYVGKILDHLHGAQGQLGKGYFVGA